MIEDEQLIIIKIGEWNSKLNNKYKKIKMKIVTMLKNMWTIKIEWLNIKSKIIDKY